jgi:5S rRNA maturation endonuclease (ribonuclease M5)
MKARELHTIKSRLSVETVLAHYASEPDAAGRWRCLFPNRHTNGDAHHSVNIAGNRATCWSQKCFEAADVFELIRLKEQCSFVEAKERAADLAGLTENGAATRRIVATYGYTDDAGQLLFQVVRFEPKGFRQRRPDGKGGWAWNLHGVRLVLYRLADALKAESVLIVEGEKDVELAYRLGLPDGWAATCNPAGAEKWRADYSDALKGKRVVILPDADEAGLRHGEQVARLLQGKAAEIFRLTLPEGAKDVSEWAESGRTTEELLRLLETATPWGEPASRSTGLAFTRLGDLLNEPEERVAWLVENHLPAAGLSLLCGKPKAGKSTVARVLALAVARGIPWLGFPTASGAVFYLALEEKRAEVRKHFAAMGATRDEQILVFCAPSPADGLTLLRQATEREKPALIIVDPLLKMVRVKDANDYASVTAALEPLLTLARQTGAHVLAVHHLGKGERDGGDAILGSTAIFGAVDTALLLKRTEKYRTLSSIQRYGEDLDEITLSLDPESRTITAGPTRQEADQESLATLILEFLKGQTQPVDEKTILEAVEGRRSLKVHALRHLITAGRVSRSGKGGKGDPFRYAPSGEQREQEPQPEHGNKNHVRPGSAPLKGSCSQDFDLFATPSESREQEAEVIDLAD